MQPPQHNESDHTRYRLGDSHYVPLAEMPRLKRGCEAGSDKAHDRRTKGDAVGGGNGERPAGKHRSQHEADGKCDHACGKQHDPSCRDVLAGA